eukprot:3220651-Amphidinium_carterae.1
MSGYRRPNKLRFSKPSKPQVRPQTRQRQHSGSSCRRSCHKVGERPRELKSVRELRLEGLGFPIQSVRGANPDAGLALDTAGIRDQPVICSLGYW